MLALTHMLVISLLLLSSVVYANVNPKSTPIPAAYIPGAYIVEFEDAAALPEPFISTLHSDHNVTTNLRLRLQYALFNGASFQLAPWHDFQTSVELIQNMSQVKNIWPVRLFSLPGNVVSSSLNTGKALASTVAVIGKRKANEAGADTYAPHVMGGVDKLRNQGYAGTGILVAVIDTGVDYNHPDLGGGFGAGFKVVKGYDLVGDDYNGLNTPTPDADPMDCYGHGTHVSGIIGANMNQYNFSGVVPNATLGMWRVFGCTGSTTEDVLISAFNMAYEAGADIITASIGQNSGWTEDAWDIVAQRIVQAGIPTVISAGNDGANGVFDTSAAAEAIGVNAVGSIDNIFTPKLLPLAKYQTNGSGPIEFSYNPSPANGDFGTISVPLYALDLTGTNSQEACSALLPTTPDLSGYVLLIRRGTCSFDIKINNARVFGAQKFLFYNNVPGPASAPGVTLTDIPAAMVTVDQGLAWLASLSDNNAVLIEFTAAGQSKMAYSVTSNNITGGYMSPFSSWGPTFETYVKPQISAPGANILSTYPISKGAYAIRSGTSMSTPYIAGVMALILEVRGKVEPRAISSLLTSTGHPVMFNNGLGNLNGMFAPVIQQGAGMVNAYKAATIQTTLSTYSITFNDTVHFDPVQSFKIYNSGIEPVYYTCSNIPAAMAYTLSAGTYYPMKFPPI
ncbi:peptidase S8/S53 domain-containing protein [Bisporella sp. PMI_857]|nr:peptidase S8/S53 domain-containing protein [Bisporella sp. PMI_857]